jgi:hypothetical protein
MEKKKSPLPIESIRPAMICYLHNELQDMDIGSDNIGGELQHVSDVVMECQTYNDIVELLVLVYGYEHQKVGGIILEATLDYVCNINGEWTYN